MILLGQLLIIDVYFKKILICIKYSFKKFYNKKFLHLELLINFEASEIGYPIANKPKVGIEYIEIILISCCKK